MSQGAPPTASKQGLSPLAWIAIGCGAVVLCGLVVFLALGVFVFHKGREVVEKATGGTSIRDYVQELQQNPAKVAAETAIRLDPDLEVVSTDDQAGTLTFRDRRSGEEATLRFEDIAQGRFSVTTDEGDFSYSLEEGGEGSDIVVRGPQGEARFGAGADLAEVPAWVPRYPGITAVQGTLHSQSGSELTGAWSGHTGDDGETVLAHFRQRFADAGWEVTSRATTTTPEGVVRWLQGEERAAGRTVTVSTIETDGRTQVTVQYRGRGD